MTSTPFLHVEEPGPAARFQSIIQRERRMQRLVTAFVLTGIAFMLLPGTFLGVWNLISISEARSVMSLSPATVQAHGHAQIFGWVGTFILGIGLYSLGKLRRSAPFPLSRGWLCWGLWTTGVLLRWSSNIYLWHWRVLLPVSALLELSAFILFQSSLRHHQKTGENAKPEAWTILVISATIGFFAALVANAALTLLVAVRNWGPAFPHGFDQRMLVLSTWGFLVVAIWGFNAKWLPVFVGLKAPSEAGLLSALTINSAGVLAALLGMFRISALLLLGGAVTLILALHIFDSAERAPKTLNIHAAFPIFVRIAYLWLFAASLLTVWATGADRAGGIWGASRHALTVGFIAAMIFAIGQRILPAFCGMKILFSPAIMLWSLVLLNVGCFLRVASEIPAYEGYWRPAWRVLPISANVELVAVALFAINIAVSILKPIKRPV